MPVETRSERNVLCKIGIMAAQIPASFLLHAVNSDSPISFHRSTCTCLIVCTCLKVPIMQPYQWWKKEVLIYVNSIPTVAGLCTAVPHRGTSEDVLQSQLGMRSVCVCYYGWRSYADTVQLFEQYTTLILKSD